MPEKVVWPMKRPLGNDPGVDSCLLMEKITKFGDRILSRLFSFVNKFPINQKFIHK